MQTYKVRSGTIEEGKDYEYKMAALLSLRCLRRRVEQMWIASNVEGAGDFDDVIIHAKEPGRDSITCMLQLKHKVNPKAITSKDLLMSKGDFALPKYLKDIKNLHESLLAASAENEFTKNLGRFEDTYFILFTNKAKLSDDIDFLEEESVSCLSFLNTNSKATPYKINFEKLSKSIDFREEISAANLYMFTNQVNVDRLNKMIEKEFKTIAGDFEVPKNLGRIAKEYVAYLTNWAKGKLGQHFYFTKEDALYIVTELLFRHHTVDLNKTRFLSLDEDKMLIWKQITEDHILTVVHTSAVDFFVHFIQTEVQSLCEHTIDNWEQQLSDAHKKSIYSKEVELKDLLLKSVGGSGKVYPLDIWKCLWRMNRLPLLLKASNCEQYETITKVLRFSNNSYKIVVLFEDVALPVEKKSDTKRFETLNDLKDEHRSMVINQKVKLQGRPGATLKDLIREESFKYINCVDIINILFDNFDVGDNLRSLPEDFVDRKVVKTLIRPEILENKEVFVIQGQFDLLDGMHCLQKYAISQKKEVQLSKLSYSSDIISLETGLNLQQLSKIRHQKGIHILSIYNEKYFQLAWSSEFSESLHTYKVDLVYLLNENEIENFLNNTTIVVAVPGMGKTVLMDYVASITPVDYWVLKVDLNKHQSYFRNQNCRSPMTEARKHLQHFYNAIGNDQNTELCDAIFDDFLALKKIVVLLDGFDEVAVAYKKEVTNIAQSLRREGYKMCITTRPLQKKYLEEALKTTSDSIAPFTVSDQKYYLNTYFNRTHRDITTKSKLKTIKAFVQQLLEATRNNLLDTEAEFTGIPLQTKLIADVFISECAERIRSGSVANFNPNFDLLDLYEKFIEFKIDLLLKKYGDPVYGFYQPVKSDQSLLALKLVFPESVVGDASVVKQVYDAYVKEDSKKQQLEHLGLISLDKKFNITSVHRTVAEYLSAEWLVENLNADDEETKELVCRLIKTRFFQKNEFFFYIFDKLTSKGCRLHAAIVNGRFNEAMAILDEDKDSADEVDVAGRSALHFVFACFKMYGSAPLWAKNRFEFELKEADRLLDDVIERILCASGICAEKDIIGYGALDYALATGTLEIAGKIQEKVNATSIRAFIDLRYKQDYLRFCIRFLPQLFELLLVYFLSRDLIFKHVDKYTTIIRYMECHNVPNLVLKSFIRNYKYETVKEVFESDLLLPYTGRVPPSDSFGDLRYAIVYGSIANVAQLLSECTDVNEHDVEGNTLLTYAVLHQKEEILELLLNAGANINKQNIDGSTLLHKAAECGYVNIAKLIIEEGNQIHVSNHIGDTPLHSALKCSSEDIAALIVEKGATVNIQNDDGDAPLHLAVGLLDIGTAILERGADVNLKNNTGDTPLHLALKWCYGDMAQLIVEKGAIFGIQGAQGNTPLHLAVLYPEIAARIIEKGGDMNAMNDDGNTPLHEAVGCLRWNKTEASELMIGKGAMVNMQNNDGDAPLHLAVASPETSAKIIEKGGDVNMKNSNGDTPLALALRKGMQSTSELLIAMGADTTPS